MGDELVGRFFTEQAQKVGGNTPKAIEQLLSTRKYPEQAYKSCAGILTLVKKKEIGKCNQPQTSF
jgi:hypothetical protein